MAERMQFMVNMDEPIVRRMDALRIVMGVSRAEVNRQAVTYQAGALAGLEISQAERLARLHNLARALDVPWEAYVRAYCRKWNQGGPSLEDLEVNPKLIRASDLKAHERGRRIRSQAHTSPAA